MSDPGRLSIIAVKLSAFFRPKIDFLSSIENRH